MKDWEMVVREEGREMEQILIITKGNHWVIILPICIAYGVGVGGGGRLALINDDIDPGTTYYS